MLAYVFWHWAAAGVSGYEERLRAFHRVLREQAPGGFLGSAVFAAADGMPWSGGATTYEDWYLLEDFAALGILNEAAVSGMRKGPHDEVAGLARGGSGGVYKRIRGAGDRVGRWGAWFSKPAGMRYEELWDRLPETAEVWQRQLVLGPAREFCLRSKGAVAELEWLDPVVFDYGELEMGARGETRVPGI